MEFLGINVPAWLILAFLSFFLLYVYSTWTHDTFIKLGIPGPKPWPFIGNAIGLMKKGMSGYDMAMVEKYGKVVGLFEFGKPAILVADVDIMKQIMVKEFSHFPNRRPMESFGKPVDSFVTNLKDADWKRVRNLMTPAFSSGKLRAMTQQVNDCANVMVQCLFDKVKQGDDILPFRNSAQAYTMDVIARTAFGIKVNSQKNPDDVFVKHAKAVFGMSTLMMLLFFMSPRLTLFIRRYMGGNFLSLKSAQFFSKITHNMAEERQREKKDTQNYQTKTDFLQLMMNAHEYSPEKTDIEEDSDGFKWDAAAMKRTKGLTMDELTSQGVLFFVAGSDTTASTLTFLCYNLALNPNIQENVYNEISDVIGDQKSLTQEMCNQLTYLEQCISETLRMYPPAVRVDRQCNDDIFINGVKFPKDITVNIAVNAVHHDPTLWPDPHKFDPDRFTPEEKAKRNPLAWIPFGFGPRNCIGMRLAQFELKVAMIKLIKNFQFSKCDQTEMPPLAMKKGALLQTEKLLILRIVARAGSED